MNRYQFMKTINTQTGNESFYINGKRVTKEAFEHKNIMCERKDTYQTVSTKRYTRHYHCGSY